MKRRLLAISCATLLGTLPLPSAAAPPAPQAAPVRAATPHADFDHAHRALAAVLQATVAGDRVDYEQVRARLPALEAYLELLAKVTPAQLEAFSREERLAFWINGYNATVLALVARAWPVRSIRDIPGVFDARTFTLAGRSLTLDRLENEIIRAGFKEPRIHFALNCAAKSCPPLAPEPFVGRRLEVQLEAAAEAFVKDPRHNRIDAAKNAVSLSRIFQWFGADFVEKYGERVPGRESGAGAATAGAQQASRPPGGGHSPEASGARPPGAQKPVPTPGGGLRAEERAVLHFVSRYVDERTRIVLITGTPRVDYLEYDWSINARPPAAP